MKRQIVNRILSKIEKLDFSKQLTFAYILTYRQLENYLSFCEQENFGKPVFYQKGLKTIRNFLLTNCLDEFDTSLLADIAPDTEDFGGNLLATAALDACGMLYDCFDFTETKDLDKMESVISLSLNALQMYIEETNQYDYNKRNYDKDVFENHLMLQEIDYQIKIATRLEKETILTDTVLNNFENHSKTTFNQLLIEFV